MMGVAAMEPAFSGPGDSKATYDHGVPQPAAVQVPLLGMAIK
jgi:hypothetical protein